MITASPKGGKARRPQVRKPKRGVDSVDVAGRILQSMVRQPTAPRLKDLEADTGIPSAKLHRYLSSLLDCGLLRRLESGNRYEFGLLALQIGQRAAQGNDALTLIAGMVAEYCEEIGQTCGLGLWAEDGVTMLRWFQADREVSIALKGGIRLPLTGSSTGMVFAAHLQREVTEPMVRDELRQNGHAGSASLEQAYRRFAKVRRDGICQGLSVRIKGLNSLSVPVFGPAGKIAYAISVAGQEANFGAEIDGPVARSLKAFASRVSRFLGGSTARD